MIHLFCQLQKLTGLNYIFSSNLMAKAGKSETFQRKHEFLHTLHSIFGKRIFRAIFCCVLDALFNPKFLQVQHNFLLLQFPQLKLQLHHSVVTLSRTPYLKNISTIFENILCTAILIHRHIQVTAHRAELGAYFHFTKFLGILEMTPIPSSTFVMSQIRLFRPTARILTA